MFDGGLLPVGPETMAGIMGASVADLSRNRDTILQSSHITLTRYLCTLCRCR